MFGCMDVLLNLESRTKQYVIHLHNKHGNNQSMAEKWFAMLSKSDQLCLSNSGISHFFDILNVIY